MMQFTEEQRAALIEFTRQRIEALRFSIKQYAFESIRKPLQSELAVAEIALAALTAEVHSYTFEDDPQPLYTTPPTAEPAVPDGWKLVPIEPTAAMYDAGDHQLATKQVWDAMLAAAPEVE